MSPTRLATSSEEQRLRTSFARLRTTAEAMAAAADADAEQAREEYHVAERDAARAEHRARRRAEAESSEALEDVCSVLLGRVDRLAAGLAAARWADPRWRDGEWLGPDTSTVGASDTGTYLRIGTFELPRGLTRNIQTELPALVPLLDVGNIALICDDDNSWMPPVLRSVLLRALATAPPGGLEISVFDPRLTGVLSSFGALRRPSGAFAQQGSIMLSESLSSPEELLATIQRAKAGAVRVAERSGAIGAANLAQLRAQTGEQPEPYRLLVLLDYPYGVDQRTQQELVRLAHAGPARGVSVVVVNDASSTAPADSHVVGQPIDPGMLLEQAVAIRGTREGLIVAGLEHSAEVPLRPDPSPDRELIELVCGQVARAAAAAAAPSAEFSRLLPPPEKRWTWDAIDEINAPIGVVDSGEIALALRGADPALPNVLIGGASGQGKSNLLLVLLHSIAAKYSPDEVEMYLLDFKDGLEFDRLGPGAGRPHWLPHARVLGLEGDRTFGLAVLRHLGEEFSRRAERFRAGGVNSLSAYRRLHPDEVVPRILLVIDEFHMLIAESDEIGREAISLLETMARRGRAVGIHLILASQTLSGIDTLATKERSIFGQFPWRVSLKTEASESEAILGRGNTEAAQLRYRGEAVLNADYGAPERNQRAVIAYAGDQELDTLREQLWRSSVPDSPPRVFYASRASDPVELARVLQSPPRRPDADTRSAVLGLGIQVSTEPVTFDFRGDPGRALALLGDGRDDALGMLSSTALSLAMASAPDEAEYVILDGLAGSGAITEELTVLASALRERGHAVTVVPAGAVGDELIGLGQTMDARLAAPNERPPSVYVIGAGMHRVPRLSQISLAGASPAEALQRLVREGPLADMYLLGWWNTARVFSEHLGYEATPLVAGLAFLRAPEADVQAMVGPYVRFQGQAHRALFVDRGSGEQPVELVPFASPSKEFMYRLDLGRPA